MPLTSDRSPIEKASAEPTAARRAWPFEDVPEGGIARARRDDLASFVTAAGEGTEAVVTRIGLHDAQLVAIGPNGAWERWVYRTVDDAEAAARRLGMPVHVGEYPEAVRVRMNAYQRPASDFDNQAYPEQGAVGPVIPYPENRPRRSGSQGPS